MSVFATYRLSFSVRLFQSVYDLSEVLRGNKDANCFIYELLRAPCEALREAHSEITDNLVRATGRLASDAFVRFISTKLRHPIFTDG